MPRAKKKTAAFVHEDAQSYQHPTAELAARPEIGTQAHFKKAKAPATYHYDSSLAPELNWDGQNPAREQAEAILAELRREVAAFEFPVSSENPSPEELDAARRQLETRNAKLETLLQRLQSLSRPFLNWCGKAERLSFDVPTLPLFVHERLSTKAILETLKGHKRDKQMDFLDVLFGSPERSLHDQVLRAYEHRDQWVNRLILGDSLAVMNSLLRFESLGGQVQMIYIDPPYGVKFGSNFQPFIRKRDVKHNDDEDFTREPEMVQAYRDTWELGLHSYLTYLRDRLLLARELLHPSGSVFVQISDENLHHVREVMDEVFGAECFVVTFPVKKKGSQKSSRIDPVNDYLLWYGKSPRAEGRTKFHSLFERRELDGETLGEFKLVELPDGRVFSISAMENANGETTDYRLSPRQLFDDFPGAKLFRAWPITNGGTRPNQMDPIEFQGQTFVPPRGRCWSFRSNADEDATIPMYQLRDADRLWATGSALDGKRYLHDFAYKELSNWWDGLGGASDALYVVQTNTEIVQRCLLMTTDPGDLVLDPTCGSGTTAYVAERWGRRWITIDTSRVPLALARQRLLTATFDYYELKDESRGPAGGFVYKRRQNKRGEEIGGIVPHITLKSIANNEPPAEEVLVDRPETMRGVVRVTGPFAVEATIPAAEGVDDAPPAPAEQTADHQTYVERMIEILRRAPVLRLPGNQTLTLRQIRPPAKTLALSAEAIVDGAAPAPGVPQSGSDTSAAPPSKSKIENRKSKIEEPVAILFGPEHGPLGERLVREAWDEAGLKHYARLLVIGFGIDPKAREFVDMAGRIGIPCVYLQASMDLQMGDLLKNMRSSQVFSVCGLPDVRVTPLKPVRSEIRNSKSQIRNGKAKILQYQAELLGLDTFDPATMEPGHLAGGDVPAWFLDTNYNGLVFRVCQAFFPRTGAWENLKKSLRVEFEDSVWEHLAGTVSAPFAPGEHGQIAVKVIDPRGNELLVVKRLEETR